jgi:hypothetical protein
MKFLRSARSLFIALVAIGMSFLNGETVSLPVAADAYIDFFHREANFGFGVENEIIAQKENEPKKGYLLFDASGLPPVTEVLALEMVYTYRYDRSADFFLIKSPTANDWDERLVTWDSAPGNDTESATYFTFGEHTEGQIIPLGTATANGQYKSFRLEFTPSAQDALLQALNEGDRKITIAFSTLGGRLFKIASKEFSRFPEPKLIIETAE